MRFHIKIKRKSLFAWIMLAIFSISSAMGTIMFADQTRMNCIERYHYLLSPPFGFRDGPIIDTGIDGVKLHTKGLENELLKIIIGVPSQIDQNESIPIFIAGLRNAKATYVIPENITVELLGLYPNEFVSIDEERYQQKLGSYIFGTAQGIIDNSQDWRLTGENDFSDGRKWISNPQTSSEEDTIPTLPVSHLGYDLPLFNCTFPALKFKATFSIRVTFTWRTPWFEILSQTASQTVQVAPWYEFEKFLQTNKDQIRDTFAESELNQQSLLSDAVKRLNTYMDSIDVVFEATNNLQDAGTIDPANMHIFVLNVTSIIDPTNPNSYISKLPAGSEKTELLNILTEINQAYQASKDVLTRKGISITETMVNYTYENHWDASALELNGTDIKYTDIDDDGYGRVAVYDADYDEEHIQDCSFEYLMEGNFWSGNPYLIHEPFRVKIDETTFSNTINIQTEQYIIENLMYTLANTNTTKHTDLYEDAYQMVKIDKITKVRTIVSSSLTPDGHVIYDEDGIAHNRGHIITGSFSGISSSEYDLYLEFAPPGGYRKPNKAVVMNLMYNLFPMPSRTYAIPHQVIDPAHQFTNSTGFTFNFPDRNPMNISNRYYNMMGNQYNESRSYLGVYPIEFQDGTYTYFDGEWIFNRDYQLSTSRLFASTPPLYLLNDDGIQNANDDMNGIIDASGYVHDGTKQIFHMNITHYFNVLMEGFSDGNPFYVNLISKPFEKLVYDSNTGEGLGNNYDSVLTDVDLTDFLDDLITEQWHTNDPDVPDEDIPIMSKILQPKWSSYPFYGMVDRAIHTSIDPAGGTVLPYPTYNYQNFYKTDTGRWIEAFFNGTVLNRFDDPTKDPTYMQTRTASGSIIPYSFRWVDTDAIPPTSEQSIPMPEYSAVPFQGPSDYPPIGITYTQRASLVQISTANLTTGLAYGYGLIYLIYRASYDGVRGILSNMISTLNDPRYNKTYDELLYLKTEMANLEIAWETLDTKELNIITQRVLNYTKNTDAITAIPNQWFGADEGGSAISYLTQSTNTGSPQPAGFWDSLADDGWNSTTPTGEDARNQIYATAKAGFLYRGAWTKDSVAIENILFDKQQEFINYFQTLINNVYWESNNLWMRLDSIEHPQLYKSTVARLDDEGNPEVDDDGNIIMKTEFNFVDFTFISPEGYALYDTAGRPTISPNDPNKYVYEEKGILLWNGTNIYQSKDSSTPLWVGIESLKGQAVIVYRKDISQLARFTGENKLRNWVDAGFVVNPANPNTVKITIPNIARLIVTKIDGFTQQLIDTIQKFIDNDLRNLVIAAGENFLAFAQAGLGELYNLFSVEIPKWALETYTEKSTQLARVIHPMNAFLGQIADVFQREADAYSGFLEQDLRALKDLSGKTKTSSAWNYVRRTFTGVRSIEYLAGVVQSELGIDDDSLGGQIINEALEYIDYRSDPIGYWVKTFADLSTSVDVAWYNPNTWVGWLGNKALALFQIVIGWTGEYVNTWLASVFRGFSNTDNHGLYGRMDDMMWSLFNGIAKMSDGIGSAFEQVYKMLAKMTGQLIQQALSTLDQISMNLETLQNVMTTIKNYFQDLISAIESRFSATTDLLNKVGDFLLQIVSDSVYFVVNLGKDIFPQLQKLEDELLRNDYFLTIMDFFYPPFTQARLASGYIDYSVASGQMNEDTFYQFVNIYKPLAQIEGANTGFRIYQIGTEFTEKLYFLTTINGTLVDVPLNVTVKRWVDNYSTWGIPEEDFPLDENDEPRSRGTIEGLVIPVQVYNTSIPINDLTPAQREQYKIPGVNYINFNTQTPVDWYIEYDQSEEYTGHVDGGDQDAYTPPAIGFYMTIASALYDSAAGIKNNNPSFVGNVSRWSELTYLFSQEYINDAFILMTVQAPEQDDQGYIQAVAGGDPMEFLVTLQNLMFSRPFVTLRVQMYSDTGTPIYQKEWYNIDLLEGNIQSVPMSIYLDRFTPGGTHRLVLTVFENNGDYTSYEYQVQVTGDDWFNTFLFGLFGGNSLWFLLGGLAVLVTAILVYRSRKASALKDELVVYETISVDSFRNDMCTDQMQKLGLCQNLPKFTPPKCDLDSGECIFPNKK